MTAAALGASVTVALRAAGLDPFLSAAIGFTAAFVLRALALLRGYFDSFWSRSMQAFKRAAEDRTSNDQPNSTDPGSPS